jgi:hypothetical protein
MTSPSPSRDNTELRDAVDMHVGLAVHRFNAAQGTVILSACTVESVDAIMALIADETAKARIDECRRFGELTGYEDYASDRIASLAQAQEHTNDNKED